MKVENIDKDRWAGRYAVDIGHGVRIVRVDYHGRDGTRTAGIEYVHPDGRGGECLGWIAFRGVDEGETGHAWTVECHNPLTLSPSLRCRACGHHGFIREGKWVPA